MPIVQYIANTNVKSGGVIRQAGDQFGLEEAIGEPLAARGSLRRVQLAPCAADSSAGEGEPERAPAKPGFKKR